ncbi:MAG: DUF4136 domain-containing protein [Rhodospirillaceae bacterium]
MTAFALPTAIATPTVSGQIRCLVAVFFLVFTAISLAGCASQITAWSDYDPSRDFSSIRTYAWASDEPFLHPTSDEPHATPLNDRRIRRAVEHEMAQKGITKTSTETADIVISFTVGTREKIRTSTEGTVWYRSRYWRHDYIVLDEPLLETYTEGTLAIDIFDRLSREQVWHGWASERIRAEDDVEALINKAVAEILKAFPPLTTKADT